MLAMVVIFREPILLLATVDVSVSITAVDCSLKTNKFGAPAQERGGLHVSRLFADTLRHLFRSRS